MTQLKEKSLGELLRDLNAELANRARLYEESQEIIYVYDKLAGKSTRAAAAAKVGFEEAQASIKQEIGEIERNIDWLKERLDKKAREQGLCIEGHDEYGSEFCLGVA